MTVGGILIKGIFEPSLLLQPWHYTLIEIFTYTYDFRRLLPQSGSKYENRNHPTY